jgi:murein DD-endopeptidase MepM/ murein hydrolase activator NlpD
MRKILGLAGGLFILLALAAGFYFFILRAQVNARSTRVLEWIKHPQDHPEWAVTANEGCPNAVFRFPTSGFIGYLWDDSFRPGHRHSGLDIFGGTEAGVTPIYAAIDGYLTRETGWISTVIIRVPSDPLHPGEQMWTYYTHMADAQGNSFIDASFPPGTQEVFVEAGTLLGYMGNFSGTAGSPTGVHLHFSIVKDDGSGKYLNELKIGNTIDPSPYFQIALNAKNNPAEIPVCGQ